MRTSDALWALVFVVAVLSAILLLDDCSSAGTTYVTDVNTSDVL